MSAVLHSGAYMRSPGSDLGLRMCPACGTEYPPARPEEGPIVSCPNDGYAILLKTDVFAAGGDLMLGRTVAQRYTIVSRLGTGSMGAVYRAWQDRMARWVALKIMRYDLTVNADSRARFEREAQAMSQLQSAHTVTVYDFGEAEDGSVYLAMELLEGESVGDRLARLGRLPIREAIHVVRGALTSLAEAHAKGIIHRDLKPDNLYLAEVLDVGGTSREICKVLDFGIAKVVRGERKVDALETQAGTVFGTPRYMSPEQAQGFRLDPRTDIYSLGVILYQMLTGAPPFEDEEAVVVMARHIKTKPRPPRDLAPEAQIPAPLESLVLCALAKDPKDRPPTADAFILALDTLEQRLPDVLPDASFLARPSRSTDEPDFWQTPRTRRRKKILVTIVTVLTTVATVVLAFVLWRSVSSEPVKEQQGAVFSGELPIGGATGEEEEDDMVFEFGESAGGSSDDTGEKVVNLENLPVVGKSETSAVPASKRANAPGSKAVRPSKTQEPDPIIPPTSEPDVAPEPTSTSTSKYGRFE